MKLPSPPSSVFEFGLQYPEYLGDCLVFEVGPFGDVAFRKGEYALGGVASD